MVTTGQQLGLHPTIAPRVRTLLSTSLIEVILSESCTVNGATQSFLSFFLSFFLVVVAAAAYEDTKITSWA